MTKAGEPSKKHHFFRALFAGLFASLGLVLALLSILLWWVSDTALSTDKYVAKVTNLSDSKPVQEFVSSGISSFLVDESDIPISEVAERLLSQEQRTGKTDEELRPLVREKIESDVDSLLDSQEFESVWLDANKQIHSQLIDSLEGKSTGPVVIDLSTIMNRAVGLLDQTEFADLKDKIQTPENKAKFEIPEANLSQPRRVYRLIKLGRIGLVILSFVFMGLGVLISTHHTRTFRRTMVFFAIFCGILAVIFSASWLLRGITLPNGSESEKQLMISLVNVLFSDLRNMLFTLTGIAVIAAITSKIIEKLRER